MSTFGSSEPRSLTTGQRPVLASPARVCVSFSASPRRSVVKQPPSSLSAGDATRLKLRIAVSRLVIQNDGGALYVADLSLMSECVFNTNAAEVSVSLQRVVSFAHGAYKWCALARVPSCVFITSRRPLSCLEAVIVQKAMRESLPVLGCCFAPVSAE